MYVVKTDDENGKHMEKDKPCLYGASTGNRTVKCAVGGYRSRKPGPGYHQHVGQYCAYLQNGNEHCAEFSETVKIYEQSKKYYDALKSVNNLVRDARKVREIILMVGDVSDIYVTGFGRMMKDENFSARELDAIASGYTKLLEESNGVLQDLKQVIDVSTLSMTDKDRMDVVDECYRDIRRYRNLVSYYTNRNIAVSYLRARKKNEMDRVMRLYGDETSRYW